MEGSACMRIFSGTILGLLLAPAGVLHADDPDNAPRPVPLTRPAMKEYLESLKDRKPRIPLPELTEEEKQKLDGRGASYEGRLQALLPSSQPRPSPGYGRDSDPSMTLDYAFKTKLFWIVSRTNNCQYCLGHQELKLAAAGMKEEQRAALDCDWDEFTPAEQAAFALARKLTYEPHLLSDVDLAPTRKHYKDLQILEIILSVSGNNAMNRWTEGLGLPQTRDMRSLQPTPEKYQDRVSKVAPFQPDDKTAGSIRKTVCVRPMLEARADVEKALEACRKRTPRLPLVQEDTARALLPADWPKDPLPQWVRLLANFPRDGKSRITGLRATEETGDLKPLLKAQVSWIIARQDRAWYATGDARRRLKQLGCSDEEIYRLDGNWSDFKPAERALFTLACKLAAAPITLTDEDMSTALKETGPREVVQLITYTTQRAFFDRLTEAAGLQLED
jgi:alkylhydroperoxidase family enzyme